MERRKTKQPKTENKVSAPEAVSSSSALPPPWVELSWDVTANILQMLGTEQILNSAQKVCSTWWKVCQDPAMWRVIRLRNPTDMYKEYAMMCRCAVDRSQGQLIDLTIENFGNEEMINYIANRSSNLKRLVLRNCYWIYGTSLAQAVKKLPELKELHLTATTDVWCSDVETIGLSCPNLKSFSYNGHWCNGPRPDYVDSSSDHEYDDEYDDENEYPFAIGRSMPHLHHLQPLGNFMQNDGLEAILDGCPLLESLDLRQCYELDLEGDLGKRCREQIKDLRLPFDSASNTEWMVGAQPDSSDNEGGDSGCFGEDS